MRVTMPFWSNLKTIAPTAKYALPDASAAMYDTQPPIGKSTPRTGVGGGSGASPTTVEITYCWASTGARAALPNSKQLKAVLIDRRPIRITKRWACLRLKTSPDRLEEGFIRLHSAENKRYPRSTMPAAESEVHAARGQLERVLASPGFSRNERIARFLRFVVEQHLGGKDSELKESVIAIEVFGRSPDHDPTQDSI